MAEGEGERLDSLMLDRLAKLFRALSGEGSSRPRMVFDEDDHRVAAAALLVHAVNADGVRTDSEMVSVVVNRLPQSGQDRRRRMTSPSLASRLSITRVSA